VVGEVNGTSQSVGNDDEYAMHSFMGYEPPIDCGIPMSQFERLMINRLEKWLVIKGTTMSSVLLGSSI